MRGMNCPYCGAALCFARLNQPEDPVFQLIPLEAYSALAATDLLASGNTYERSRCWRCERVYVALRPRMP